MCHNITAAKLVTFEVADVKQMAKVTCDRDCYMQIYYRCGRKLMGKDVETERIMVRIIINPKDNDTTESSEDRDKEDMKRVDRE
jgi:hypothetical protein